MAVTNSAQVPSLPDEDTTANEFVTTITYTAPAALSIPEEDATAQVIYTDETGFTHQRTINVPRLENGSVDEEYYQEILEGQLRGVHNKVAVNAITFTDPNASPEAEEGTPA